MGYTYAFLMRVPGANIIKCCESLLINGTRYLEICLRSNPKIKQTLQDYPAFDQFLVELQIREIID